MAVYEEGKGAHNQKNEVNSIAHNQNK